jgi:hypothetical protein
MTHNDRGRAARRPTDDDNDDDAMLARRESLIDRRLRAARGEPVEDSIRYDDDDDDDDDYEPRSRRGRNVVIPMPMGGGCTQAAVYIFLALATITALVLLLGRQAIDNMAQGITQSVPNSVREIILTPTPTVRDRGGTITQIQALNRIETLQFSVERVVEAGTERGDFLDAVLGERLLLIASGDVVAGVDLSRLRSSDITISDDGTSITIKLPPSEIFSARLNNDRTRVYDRDTKIGTQLTGGSDPTLETQARQAAESEILKAACEGDVMRRSADEAKRSMEQFLKLLEFENITVLVEPGQCVAPAAGR